MVQDRAFAVAFPRLGLSVHEVQQSLLDELHDVFEGLGCVEGEYNIKLKTESLLRFIHRDVPLRLREKLKETLIDLETKDIIAKLAKPVGWVSNLVIVKKTNGTLRVCLDPPDLIMKPS